MDEYTIGDVILDRYEVTAVLGRGGMGYVLAAQDRRLGRAVALKFLLASLRDRPLIAARFEREARTATLIVDEHVARVHTVETTPDGVPFMVMEYLRGEDLADFLDARGPLPIAEAVDLLLQACEALAQAHKLGVVHRDLKPSNLFRTTAFDGAPLVKVLDFGISKSALSDEAALTSTDGVLGTPAYMSPEQLSGRTVDARSDVWALGVILYEMLAGERPFRAATPPLQCAAILDGTYTDLSEHRPDVPEELEDSISEALARDLEWRLPSVEAFAQKVAPFGTDGARASYRRIQRIAAPTSAPPEPPRAPSTTPTPTATPIATSTDLPTSPSQVAPKPTAPPASLARRRTLPVAVGLASVAALAFGLVRSRVTPAPTTPQAPPVLASTTRTTDAGADATAQAAPSDPSACKAGATPACEAACTAHQPGSCHELAKALVQGTGAPKDPGRAATLFQTDCDAGSLASCNLLGNLYARGEGVEHDDAKAIALFDAACRADNASACVNLGTMHYEGTGFPRDPGTATPLFLRGCDGGEPLGCLNVAAAYHEGKGAPKDLEQSYAYLERACAEGAPVGCTRQAAAKVRGEGTPKDVKGGLAQLEALCAKKEASACEQSAAFRARGVGTDVPADPLRVRESLRKGCAAGAGQDCAVKKTLDVIDTTATNASHALDVFQTKCDAGMMLSCALLGDSLINGSMGPVDKARGAALREKACKGGYAAACKPIGGAGGR